MFHFKSQVCKEIGELKSLYFVVSVPFKMLEAKVIFLLVLILNITDGTNLPNCKEIMEIFYQTEDQFYELDCTESQKLESNITLTYHCRSLQKKMDIFGRKYIL